MRTDLALPLLALALVASCRNLDVPPPEATAGKGPNVQVLSPQDGQRMSLVYPVRLQVEDLDGVQHVLLLCGGLTLWTWVAPPFEASVDFSSCRQLAPPDAETFSAPLTVTATDSQGNVTTRTLSVTLDLTAPVLTVLMPRRVLPNATVHVTVHSDRPLQGPPTVRLAGTPMALTQAGTLEFAAAASAPGLGTDLLEPEPTGCPYPIDALEDIERSMTVSVEGRSLAGNTTALDLPLVVSRVAWERALPGVVFTDTGTADPTRTLQPTATDGGLQVPMEIEGTRWIPAFLSADDGRYVPTDPALVSGSFRGRAFDSVGRALLDDGNALLSVEPAALTGTVVPVPARFPAAALTRVGDALCVQTSGTCGADQLRCARGAAYVTSNAVTSGAGTGLGAAARLLVRSGDTVMGLDFSASTACCAGCGGRALFGGLTTLSNRPLLPSSTIAILRILPTGHGAFVVHSRAGAAAPVEDLGLVDAAGTYRSAAYSAPVTDTLLLATKNNSLITMRALPSTTPFFSWKPGVAAAERSSCIPGVFLTQPGGTPPLEVPLHAIEGPNGEVTALLTNENYGRVVVHFDAQLKPKWIYRYPRLVVTGTGFLAAYGDGPLYFVDPFNGVVVALGR